MKRMSTYAMFTAMLLSLGASTASATIVVQNAYHLGEAGSMSGELPQDYSGNVRHFTNSSGGTRSIVAGVGGPLGTSLITSTAALSNSTQNGPYVTNAPGPSFNPPTDNWGIEIWAKTSNLSQASTSAFGWGNGGLSLGYNRGGTGFIAYLPDSGGGVSSVIGSYYQPARASGCIWR